MKVKRDSFYIMNMQGICGIHGSRQKLRSYDAIRMQPDLSVCRA